MKTPTADAWQSEVTQALCDNHERLSRFLAGQIPARLRSTISTADVLQELAIDAYKAPPGSVNNWDYWLTKAARHILLNLIRDWNRIKRGGKVRRVDPGRLQTSSLNLINELHRHRQTPSRVISAQEAASAVTIALARLPEHMRTVIQLSRFEGLSRREIAERTGRSEAMVAKLIHQGLSELRESLSNVVLSLSSIGHHQQTDDTPPEPAS